MLKIYPLLSGLIMLVTASCSFDHNTAQPPTNQTTAYQAGYQVISFVDSSRIYRPNVNRGDRLYFRPIEIDLWYPAQPASPDSTLRFGYFLHSLQKRANLYSAPQQFDNLSMTVAQSFCDGVGCSQPSLLLQQPTHTFNQPKPIQKRFPLILYVASFGSMGYENYLLFESLVRQGYIIACVSSIGRYPGEMTMKNADLMEQVTDAEQILNRLKRNSRIDTTKIGLLGYSWGGLAGALLAMQRHDIDAIVSLDGSEVHHYGYAKSEDQDFEQIVTTPFLKESVLSVPYLRLESKPGVRPSKKDSSYNFLSKVKASKRVIKIDSAEHQDFSSLPTVVRSSGNCSVPKVYRVISTYTIAHFNRYLKSGTSATK